MHWQASPAGDKPKKQKIVPWNTEYRMSETSKNFSQVGEQGGDMNLCFGLPDPKHTGESLDLRNKVRSKNLDPKLQNDHSSIK